MLPPNPGSHADTAETDVALLQLLIQRNLVFKQRLLSFSHDNVAQRLARALLLFAERALLVRLYASMYHLHTNGCRSTWELLESS